MDSHADPDADGQRQNQVDEMSTLPHRFERVIRGKGKPKPPHARRPLLPLKNEERRERLASVQQLVHLGMSVEQIADYAPTINLPLSRSTVYEYLNLVKTPRSYKTSEGQQSHHDYYTFRFFIRIAGDAAKSGYRTKKLLKGRLAWEGARFRPDMKFEVQQYLFFMELQLSDLTETRWAVKFANYHRLRQMLGRKFRVLFVIDQKRDLAYVRAGARAFLKRKGSSDKNLFLFICLDDLKGSANVATDAVWLTPDGKKRALLEWLPLPGQKPPMQRQR